jgi:flavin-dependent dehydrogenase
MIYLKTLLLIGADGGNSVVARQLRGKPRIANRILGVRGYFDNVEGSQDQADLCFNNLSFPGYCWLLPIGGSEANVTLQIMADALPNGTDLAALLMQLIRKDTALNKRLRNAQLIKTIASWSSAAYDPQLPAVGERVMLVGDAAGLSNAINGKGIQNALLSGKWASSVAASCLSKNDFSMRALSAYSDRLENELRLEAAFSGLVTELTKNQSLNPIWLRTLEIIVARAKVDPSYAETVLGILCGQFPSSAAIDYKIVIGTMEQAAISLSTGMIIDAIRNPKGIADAGAETIQTTIRMFSESAQHAPQFLSWAVNSAAHLGELSIQVSKKTVEQAPKAKPAIVTIKVC